MYVHKAGVYYSAHTTGTLEGKALLYKSNTEIKATMTIIADNSLLLFPCQNTSIRSHSTVRVALDRSDYFPYEMKILSSSV